MEGGGTARGAGGGGDAGRRVTEAVLLLHVGELLLSLSDPRCVFLEPLPALEPLPPSRLPQTPRCPRRH